MQIEFLCEDPAVLQLYPPKPANKVIPSWYKDLSVWKKDDALNIDTPTIKNCMPAQDYMLSGYIIFNTYEFTLLAKKNDLYENIEAVCPHMAHLSSHHHEQMPVQIKGSRKQYFKIAQPWMVKTPPGYSCLFQQPFYHFEERYQLLPAIVDTDLHDLNVEIPGYLLTNESVKIESGTPLVQVIPFKRDNWHSNMKVASFGKSKLANFPNKGYQREFHSKKNYK